MQTENNTLNIIPYTKADDGLKYYNNPDNSFLDKLYYKTQEFLVNSYERVLVSAFQEYKNNHNNTDFSKFGKYLLESNWKIVFDKYPALKKIFFKEEEKIHINYLTIHKLFSDDTDLLVKNNILNNLDNKIEDIEIGIGDFHLGKSTAIVSLENNREIIFKPTNGNVSKAYFKLLEWMDNHLSLGDYKYKVLNKYHYHWQEFVNQTPCESTKDLEIYYKRAGYLLTILYMLNSTDFHAENIISNGNTPILIDHETIFQPRVGKKYLSFFKNFSVDNESNDKEDSVLNSCLLPNNEAKNLFPIGMCGFGCNNQRYGYSYQNVGVNRFTDNWDIVPKLVKEDFIKKNVPEFNGDKIFANNYIEKLTEGFEESYKLFADKKEELLSENSPLRTFENVTIRHIWRSTNVY
jgi:lantibiotic modifying enzyme